MWDVCVCNCVCFCFAGFRPLRCCAPTVCVCVVWWALCGQRFVGLRATQLMGHLAQPQNPSGLITAPVQPPSSFFPPPIFPSFFLSSPLNPSFLSFSTRPCSQPRVVCNCPAPFAGTYITPSERESESETITAGSSHIDWLGTHADSDTKGNIAEKETRRGVGVYPSGRNEGLVWRDTKANSWPKCVSECVLVCVFEWGDTANHLINFLLCLQLR